MRCGVICHSSMSDVWFTVCGGEWQQLLQQMVAPHITDSCSVIIVKFLFVYLPLRDLIMIYRFYPCICLRRSINWLLKTVIVHTDLVFTFGLIACVTVPVVQKVGISGPWGWVLWSVLHITGVFSVSSQYTIHHSLRHLHCLGNGRYCSPAAFIPMTWWYFFPWWSQTDRSQKVDFWGGQSCVGLCIVQRLYGQFHSFLPDMLPGIYTSYWQFIRKPLNV